MTSINKETISNVGNSLNVYDEHIDNLNNIMNKNNDYDSNIYEQIDNSFESKNNISAFLQDLGFSTSVVNDDIVNMDNSYNHFYNRLKKSKEINSELKNTISKYEAVKARLKNSEKSNAYFVLMVWGIIFLFVMVTLFFSIIEDKKELNIFSKTLLFLFLLVVLFYSAKNFKIYIERNVQ